MGRSPTSRRATPRRSRRWASAGATMSRLLGRRPGRRLCPYQGTWLAGATIVALRLPMRSSLDPGVRRPDTCGWIRHADASLVVADPELAALVVPEPGDPSWSGFDDLAAGDPALRIRLPDGPERWRSWSPPADPHPTRRASRSPTVCSAPTSTPWPRRWASTRRRRAAVPAAPAPDRGQLGLPTLPTSTGACRVLGAPQDSTPGRPAGPEWTSTYGGTATAGLNSAWLLATRAPTAASRWTCPPAAGRSTGPSPSILIRSRPSCRPGAVTGCGPRPSSRPSAWPRWRSAARPGAAVGDGELIRRPPRPGDRALADPRIPEPRESAAAAARLPGAGLVSGSSIPIRTRRESARRASSRSGARW